ncbi:MAG: ABC transporter ATP-binding protein [Pseudomonadota bacterium]
MADPRASLVACEVAVARGGRRVVEPLSFALEPGTLTAICGPNGAGKSSLLMTLAGLLPIQSGEVTLGGKTLASIPARERARAIGYLPQDGALAWDIAVLSLVALGRHPHGDAASPSGARAIATALADAQLHELARRPVSQLSGGERARALLARVLAGEPQWILADEPLAALDLAHQMRMMRRLRQFASADDPQGPEQGVVVVVHDLAMAMNYADRVLVLKDGALIAEGPPEAALAPKVIAQGWGIAAQWLGESGERALRLPMG